MMFNSLADKRIFIIEDNLYNRSIMQLLLEQYGAEVSFERWGIEAIDRLLRFLPVDLILLDLMFPGKVTGYGIFDEIRAHPDLADIPIVAVSASEPAVAVPNVRSKGFHGFIAKPVVYDSFPQLIKQALDGQEVWSA